MSMIQSAARDHLQIVLDDEQGSAIIDESLEGREQLVNGIENAGLSSVQFARAPALRRLGDKPSTWVCQPCAV